MPKGQKKLGKGPFNNYVDKLMGGEGVKKCLFLSMLSVKKLSTQGGGVNKWQNSVHVVVECPLIEKKKKNAGYV